MTAGRDKERMDSFGDVKGGEGGQGGSDERGRNRGGEEGGGREGK